MPSKKRVSEVEAFVAGWKRSQQNTPVDVPTLLHQLYMQIYGTYELAVVTALTKEFAAVLQCATGHERIYHALADVSYTVVVIPALKGGSHQVILAQAPKMGNSSSAIAAATILKDFPNIQDVLMVGIAGGIPDILDYEKDVRVGDIVVSHQKGLVQYDMTKIEENKITVRSIAPPPSARLLKEVDYLEAMRLSKDQRPWIAHIARSSSITGHSRPSANTDIMTGLRTYREGKDLRRKNNEPVVHYGIIGSANSLLKDSKLRDELAATHNVRAVEMEGSGIADAAWFAGKGYLIVRGICDYCDMKKNDVWQGYAASAAAGYCRALIELL